MHKAKSIKALRTENSQLRKVIAFLIEAGTELSNSANDWLNLDLAVGNDDSPDVRNLSETADRYKEIARSAERFIEYVDRE